jgi:SprT protein
MTKKSMDPTFRLLTPELRKEVLDKQEECYARAEKFFKTKLKRPEVYFDIKSRTGGMAYHGQNMIRYNLILLVENKNHFIVNVVPHEVAHLVNRAVNKPADGKKKLMPHGAEWKHIMREVFDVHPRTTHNYDVSSIEKRKRKKTRSIPRTDSALNVVRSVIKRVEKRFNEEERAYFWKEFISLVNQ